MKKFTLTCCLVNALFIAFAHAEPLPMQPFDQGSYQRLLRQHKNRPLILALWSLTCSSCMKEMGLLHKISGQHPELTIVLVSVDDFAEVEQVQRVLQKYQLNTMNNWLFTEANSTQLRYQIDPAWYGELPRTYFYNADHDRTGVSGVLSEQDYAQRIAKILP